MFINKDDLKSFANKVGPASPTLHGDELKYIADAYNTTRTSMIGANINEVERVAAEKAGVKYAVEFCNCISVLHLCVKFAAERKSGSR